MTVRELAEWIDRKVLVFSTTGNIRFEAQIVDVKVSYGTERFLVRPVNGVGEGWVQRESFKLVEGGDS